MKFYLDEHFSSALAIALRAQGLDVISADEANNKGLSDEEVLRYCASEERHLVTRDQKDFIPLAVEWIRDERDFPTILFVTRSIPFNQTTHLIYAINKFASSYSADEYSILKNTVSYIRSL